MAIILHTNSPLSVSDNDCLFKAIFALKYSILIIET